MGRNDNRRSLKMRRRRQWRRKKARLRTAIEEKRPTFTNAPRKAYVKAAD